MIDRNAPITITLTMTYEEWCEVNEAVMGYAYDYGDTVALVRINEAIDAAQAPYHS